MPDTHLFPGLRAPYSITKERVTPELVADMIPLFKKHHDEVGQGEPFDPDYIAFFMADQVGTLSVFVLRAAEDIIGYALFFVRKSLFAKQVIQAFCQAIFVSLEHRARMGFEFVRRVVEEVMRSADQVRMSVRPERDFSTLLRRMGFTETETVYTRWK